MNENNYNQVPVQPVMEQPVSPVAPIEPLPQASVQTPVSEPKKGKLPLIIIIVILLLVICGLVLFIFFNKKEEKVDDKTTTTTTTTTTIVMEDAKDGLEIDTTTGKVTTAQNTTTTRIITSSYVQPIRRDETIIELSRYTLSAPSGFIVYDKSGYPQMVDQDKGVSVLFADIATNLLVLQNNKEAIYETFQKQGFTVDKVSEGHVGSRPWITMELKNAGIEKDYTYIYGATELDSESVVETYSLYAPNSETPESMYRMLTTMIDSRLPKSFSKPGSNDISSLTPKDPENELEPANNKYIPDANKFSLLDTTLFNK